ncbi:hypothetical protein CATMIT_01567, partial [Catenibacterium mitsuokai DSM 15897]
EPAHPQQRRADHGEGDVVRLERLASVAHALADEVGADQTGDAGVDVHHRAAGEVDRALGEQIAVRPVPDHVRDRQVGEGEPDRREQQHRGELDALGEGADDQRAGDAGEGRLERHEHVLGQRHAGGERRRQRVLVHALEEQFVERADEGVAAGEGQRVTVGHPQQHDQREHRQHLHQHRQHVLGAHQAAVEQGQAGHGHQQHQQSRGQHPGH